MLEHALEEYSHNTYALYLNCVTQIRYIGNLGDIYGDINIYGEMNF